LQEFELRDGADERLLKTTGKPYTSKAAYAALDRTQEMPDMHGRHIWATRVPNKVKVFAWLYFKNRLSTRSNLHDKHVLDDDQCQRCGRAVENRHHTFFLCSLSSEVWRKTGLEGAASTTDEDIWNYATPPNLDAQLWPFVLLTILWRLWDARNGEIF
jgi:hypothetical protein